MVNLPNKRLDDILFILLKNINSITINDLAKRLDVSNRTIRSDLKKLEEWLVSQEIDLVKKPGVGVWLRIDDLDRRKLQQSLFKTNKYNNQLSPYQRQQYILKSLLQFDSKYTAQLLAEELYVSRATIYKDLKEVEKWLEKYNLSLKRMENYRIEIEGKETKWRKAVADLLAELKNNQELNEMLEDSDDLEPDSRIDRKTYRQIKNIFGDIGFEKIENILEATEKKLNFYFTDEAFIGLLIHITISLERLKKNKDIKMKDEQLESLRDKEEFQVAKFIAGSLEEELGVKVPQDEIGYISLHILGSKLQQNIHLSSIDDVLQNSDPKVIEIAKDIIVTAEEVLNVNLSDDDQLLLGLVLHLRPAINRLKYGMSLRNPLLDQIKNNYPSIFGAAWATSIIFEEHLGVKIEEEEIGYIALHLGAALERIKNKARAVIVCGSGIGTSQLVATKLSKRLLGIEIVDLVSAHKLNQRELQDIDIIITTIPLKEDRNDIIQISPLVTDNDINLIKNKVDNLVEIKKKDDLYINYNETYELFNNDLIFVNLDLDSKEKIIKFLSDKLLEKGKVNKDFIKSVLERENFTSTRMAMGVAIPHGTEENYILESTIAIATLAKPVEWGNGAVDIVFLLALKRKKGRRFFKHFHLILENAEILTKIKKSTTKQDIMKKIVEFNKK